MSTIVTRSGKGSPLTHNEVDTNFSNLNTDKIQSGNTVAALTITALTTPSVQATNSAGLALKNSAGTTQMSMGAGGGDNMAINVSTNLNGTNAQIDISPTGTGHVHIKPTGVNSVEIAPTYVGEMDNITIGANTAAAGSFTNLSVTGTVSFDGAQGTAGQVLTSAGTGNTPTWATVSSVMRNRIINGAMVIDQRNAGASVTASDGVYTVDRWKANNSVNSKYTIQQNAGSVTPPEGFTNYLGITSSAATTVGVNDYYFVRQPIEGFNTIDLDFGKSTAKTVTLSFWVRSSLTGTFGGTLNNSAVNRTYPFTYTINSANTWEYKTITIAGDTTGTWLTTNGIGLYVSFAFGVGSTYSAAAGSWVGAEEYSATGAVNLVSTSGATLYLTGVQLEKGTQATGFEYRQYGQELALCQRYYQKNYLQTIAVGANSGSNENQRSVVVSYAGSEYSNCIYLKQTMRATPAVSLWNDSGTANSWVALPSAAGRTVSAGGISDNGFSVSAATTGDGSLQGMWAASAEL
jgi:hypothetical protein